jgi:hypothetical protein
MDDWQLITNDTPRERGMLGAAPGATLTAVRGLVRVVELCPDGAVTEGRVQYDIEANRLVCITPDGVVEGFTHWRPLPTPPDA